MKNKLLLMVLPTAAMLTVLTLNGQESTVIPAQTKYMHHEVPDDPYLPNAHNNQLTSPGFRYRSVFKSGTERSSITTVQVNVNIYGENILGDAANEPSIAVNPLDPGNMVIGWRQFDNVSSNFRQAGWAFSFDKGESWTFPGVIEQGIFRSDPVLDTDAEGNFYYNSLTNDPDYFCKVFGSGNGGAGWDTGTDAAGGDKQWMVIDRSGEMGNGHIYSFWSYYFSTCAPGFFTRSTNSGSSYENCSLVDGNPYWGTMAVGNSGELYIAGTSGIPDSLVVSKSYSARDRESPVMWDQSARVYFGGNPTGWSGVNPGGLLGQVIIDVDRSDGPGRDNVYVLSSVYRSSSGDPCDVMFARSEDGGLTWSPPVQVNDDQSVKNYQWFGTMSVAPNGRIDAIWLDTRDAPAGSDSSALYYSFSTDQGKTWSVNEKLSASFDSHVGYPNQNKMGDYFDMESDNLGAHVAWANTLNGEQDVYYSHIIPYVNSSGISDMAGISGIRAYPNPAAGKLVVSGMKPNSRVEVYSIPGEKLYADIISGETCEIDISDLPAGIFFLKVIDQKGNTVVKKITKEQ